jgi:large subunit ribosomal protein L4
MISVPMFDMQGQALQPVEVDESSLGGRVRRMLLRQAVLMYQMNRHVCTKGHLTRGEVSGSTRKIYRQKHTGNARAGQRTVAHRRGGGMAFPPKTRDISYHIPREARRGATRSALLARLRDGMVSLVSEIPLDAPKTKAVAGMLKSLRVEGRCLIVVDGDNPNVLKSARNIPTVTIRRAPDINAYDLLQPGRLIFTRTAFQRVVEALRS